MESIKNKQEIMKQLCKNGCYFLSILYLSEQISNKEIDPIRAYVECLKEKIIDEQSTVVNPERLIFKYTKNKFLIAKENAEYLTTSNEYEILVFANEKYIHFVVGDGHNNIECDPLGHSNTVATGKLIGKRIFRK